MPVVGVGVDVCSVARLEAVLSRTPAAARRLFTSDELDYAGAGAATASRLAARFAAKEALVKALGGSVAGMTWHDASVDTSGRAPRLRVVGAARSRADELGIVRWHLSLSHDAGVAVALVVAES